MHDYFWGPYIKNRREFTQPIIKKPVAFSWVIFSLHTNSKWKVKKKKKEKGEELINIFMKQKKSEKKAHKKLKKSFVVAILSPSLNKARKKSKAH